MMYVSENLEVRNKNNKKNMIEYNVHYHKHNYYMTQRFELCALNINKYIFNHIDGSKKLSNSFMHLLYLENTKILFIIQKVNTEDGTWKRLNDKRLKLLEILSI